MTEVWDTNTTRTVEVGDTEVKVEGEEITAEDVKNAANDNGVKKFRVENTDGDEMGTDDFPVEEDLVVKEYNENA